MSDQHTQNNAPPEAPPTMTQMFARGAAQHPRLTVLVLFLGLLIIAGTFLMFGTIAYRLTLAGGESKETEAPAAPAGEPGQGGS